ncbi:hypothetical protein ACH5RR_005687 [Cinchona calisaya]|uniref:Retrovirus-related Pol polyprotein from transposon TNT 1-94-like beta-barrel domain-containing protein n=1 Tax=Cinchona calisaya TaxID=153742 RepID=A0ABD3ALX9_9GENT
MFDSGTEFHEKCPEHNVVSVVSEKAGLADCSWTVGVENWRVYCWKSYWFKRREKAWIYPTELKLYKRATVKKLRQRISDDDKLVRKHHADCLSRSICPAVIDGRGKLGHLTREVKKPEAGDPWMSELDQCYSDEWDCTADRVLQVYLFLAGLNNEVHKVRSRVLGKKPLPTLREAFSEVRREETRRKVMLKSDSDMKPAPENSALATIQNEPESDKKKKSWCGIPKTPAGKFMESHRLGRRRILVTTGLSKQLERNKGRNKKKIKLADGSFSAIAGIGTIEISPSIVLHDVLHVPNLSCNLVSEVPFQGVLDALEPNSMKILLVIGDLYFSVLKPLELSLRAFTEVFKESGAESSMKLACLSALGDKLDPAVLHLLLRVGKAAKLISSFSHECDQMQYVLADFYSTHLDDRSVCYGLFMRLTQDIQDLSLCCMN